MHTYLTAYMQCYAKTAAYLESTVLPDVTDSQIRQGIQFCIDYAKQQADNIQKAAKEVEDGSDT